MTEYLGAMSPFADTPYRAVDPGGLPADAAALLWGTKLGAAPAGTATVVSYSFVSASSTWEDGTVEALPAYDPHGLSEVQRAAARAAFATWAKITDVIFVEVPDSATSVGVVRLGVSSAYDTAITTLPYAGNAAGDIWLPADFDDDAAGLRPGGYGFAALVHEIGHALGLTHPHEGSPPMSQAEDWLGNSVMSYRSHPGDSVDGYFTAQIFPATPMADDILAIRALYGTRAVATGDDIYRWQPGQRILQTILDDGGTDTLDWSNQTSAASIDLRMGAWSRLGPAYAWDASEYTTAGSLATTLRIATTTVIENATGGGNGDVLRGNGTHNRLLGLGGADRIDGAAGDDELNGGAGSDTIIGGDGQDFLFGGDGADLLGGGGGRDRIYGGPGDDALDGGVTGDDLLNGGPGDDVLYGGTGSDELTGGAGRDHFVIGRDAGAVDRITDFAAGIDRIVPIGGLSAGELLTHAGVFRGSTYVELQGGQMLVIEGTSGPRSDWFG